MAEISIGLVGAGVIGLTHIDAIARTEGFRLAGIVDPGPRAPDIAAAHGAPLFADVEAMIAVGEVDALIVATPNELHVPVALAALEAGLPVLVEKPVADTVAEAGILLAAIGRTGVPVLVGHHRRHNPIGKDDAYFDVAWRRMPGVGGPLLINLIHEVDLMRHLFGDVGSVAAVSSNDARGLKVEDTAAAILSFEKGGMAQMSVSDAAVGPWAWDLTAGENLARFPAHPVPSHLFAGSEGGLSLPDLTHWFHEGRRSWTEMLRRRALPAERQDSYVAVEGAKNLATIAAIREAADTGRRTKVEPVGTGGSERKRAS
jgi:predicted dehydrogenase